MLLGFYHGDQPRVDCKKLHDMCSFVIVNYEGSHFPGLGTKVKKKSVTVSTMIKCGLDHWKWHERKDEVDYSPKEIMEIIEPPAIVNNRRAMHVPETDKYWK